MTGQALQTGHPSVNKNVTQHWRPRKSSLNNTRGILNVVPAYTVTTALYEADETAWLEAVADRIRHGRLGEVELDPLAEYLTDMARRDRWAVYNRLVRLLMHVLKWEHEPTHRSGSWVGTILEQRRRLRQLLESGILRNHANDVFEQAYAEAREQAAAETELPLDTFPEQCRLDLEGALNYRPEGARSGAEADRPDE